MAMLHPKFNHLGTSKKTPKAKTPELLKAEKAHAAFLAKHGIRNLRRPKLKGSVTPSYYIT